jgi:hypothetical protein
MGLSSLRVQLITPYDWAVTPWLRAARLFATGNRHEKSPLDNANRLLGMITNLRAYYSLIRYNVFCDFTGNLRLAFPKFKTLEKLFSQPIITNPETHLLIRMSLK